MGNILTLKYLTDDGLADLKASFDKNLDKYITNDQNYFLDYLNKNEYLQDSIYTIEDFRERLVYTNNSDKDDFENIKVIYESMKTLPAYIMMDDRFWSAFNHTVMWDYVLKRSEGFKEGVNNQRDKIFNSFFTHTRHGKKRGTYVNCVSRLWWAGRLTYDKDRDNPFELTEELCKKGFASTIIPFSSSNITGCEKSRKALLDAIRDLRINNIDVKRDDITNGLKYLNCVAGSTLIDLMQYSELKELISNFYNKYYSLT